MIRVFCAASSSLFIALLLAGCCAHTTAEERHLYTGPTMPLSEVITRIDANNDQIPSLWTRHDFNGSIVDDEHDSHAFSARGVLLYRAPGELLIKANDDFGNLLFEIGATDQFYWLKVIPQDTMWWGHIASAARPARVPIPVRPDLILDVLAVGTIDTHLARPPYPVMRFDNAGDFYVIDSIRQTPDRLLVQKEVCYDRATLEPRRVVLFDSNGRQTLRATLDDAKALAAPGAPKIAMHYRLFFPDSGSVMEFTFSDATLSKNGIPHARTIRLPDLGNPGVKKVIAIDQND